MYFSLAYQCKFYDTVSFRGSDSVWLNMRSYKKNQNEIEEVRMSTEDPGIISSLPSQNTRLQ